ncbi:MAG: hypothetical protein ACT4PZ_14115 [Panacagrimonas sp.]
MEQAEKDGERDRVPGGEPRAANDPGALDQAARGIGLRRISAYVPTTERETAEQTRKREHRERMRRQRAEAISQGFRQINIPKVPVELIERVHTAVDEVLQGKARSPQDPPQASPPQPPPPPTGVSRKQVTALVAVAALLGLSIGLCVAFLI